MGRLRAWLGLRPRLGLLRRALHPHRRPCRHGEQRREERARRRAAEGAEAGLHAPSRHADQPPVLDGRRRLRLDLRHRELDRRCQRARLRPRRREQVRQRRHQALWRHGCQHVRRRCKGRRLCADVWSGRRQASAGPSRNVHALCRPRRSHHRRGLHGAADPRPDARQVGLARRGERGQRLAAAFPVGMQCLLTPVHLLALNMYNVPIATPAQRASQVGPLLPSSTLARMGRFGCAYGIGGIMNTRLTNAAREWAVRAYAPEN